MDYSSLILKKTKMSRMYMNGYRMLRYELKGLCYLTLTVLPVLLWESFFHDSVFGTNGWWCLIITVLLVPLLYCYLRPISLSTVAKFLDNQLQLQQRLETCLENMGKGGEVVTLQRKDTFHFLNVIEPVSVIKFRWPFEARILPFILFFIFLLFAGNGLFDSEKRFVTDSSQVKEEDIHYQVIKNPFKISSPDLSGRINDSRTGKNKRKIRKIFKTSAGSSAGLTGLRLPENDKIQSEFNSADKKTVADQNQQRGDDSIRNIQGNKIKRDRFSRADNKILINPAGVTNSGTIRKREMSELYTKQKPAVSTLTETDSSNAESILDNKAENVTSSGINNLTEPNDKESAGIGTSSVSKGDVKMAELLQHSFVGDLSYIEEMISSNNVEPSLREYVKKYFLSLSGSSGMHE